VFLKSADGKVFQGRSLSNEAAFVDFFHPNTSKWWDNELTQFHKEMMEFDGIWLDRNEPSNICNGACIENQRISNSMQDQFYYTPTGRSLETKSLPVDLKHANGYTQLDSHNYYGSHQAYATYNWFKSAN
jgi:alpha-glucosidase (family GH31 glycosyl hydrolase)